MNLIELYKSILSVAGMSVDDDGFISFKLARMDKKPVIVKGKRLVLPTTEQLRNPDLSNRVMFHPLSESILRGESEVVTSFREHITKRLNFIIGYVSYALLDLAISVAEHQKLSPQQTEFLSLVKDADQGTLERMRKVTENMFLGDASQSFAHMRVQKNGMVAGVKHRRVGVVYFPFYEELKKVPAPKEPNEIYGVKLRKVDREAFTALMEYLIPDIDKIDKWMFPSDSEIAPTLDALMRSVIAVGDPLNSVVDLFKDHIESSDDLYFDGEWEESFKNLNALLPQIRMIPMQPGNEGRMLQQGQNVVTVDVSAPQTVRDAAPMAQTQQAPRRTLGMPAEEEAKIAIKPPVGGLSAVSEQHAPAAPMQHPLAPPPMQMQQPTAPSWAGVVPAGNYPPTSPMGPGGSPAQYMPQPMVGMQQPVQYMNTANGLMPVVMGPNGQWIPVQNSPMMQPQMAPMGGGYGAPNPMQPQAPIQRTARGLDMNSIVAANPQMMQNLPQPTFVNQSVRSTPSWAQPNTFGGI